MLKTSHLLRQFKVKCNFDSFHFRRLATTASVKPKVHSESLNNEPEIPQQKGAATKNLSFVANLFHGQFESRELFPYPCLLNADQLDTVRMILDPIEKFFREVNDPARNDSDEKIDANVLKNMWDLGFFGTLAPVELGGLGLNYTQLARLGEIVGASDLGVAVTIAAHQSIGFNGILLFGTKEQKQKYVPRVTSGELAAFCLTEPSSGSDANSIRTRAVLSPDGKHYILNGSKIWISNGGLAEILTVFAQTALSDPKTGQVKDRVTAFIVERSFGGVTNGPPEKKMGIKGSNTAEIFFEDVKVPIENVLGKTGNGFKVAVTILNNGRFGMAAAMTGTMKTCIKKAADFSTNRVQFGTTIDNFKGIQEKFARMAMLQYVTESLAYMIAGNMDNKSQNYHLETAIAKIFSSEAAWHVCDESIQIMGGMGYMKETGLERILRDLRIFRIFEGANDVLRLFIALTAIQSVGGHLKEIQKAFKNPVANLGLIFSEATKRVGRSVGLAGVPNIEHLVHKELVLSTRLVAGLITEFGQVVEKILIKHGKNIINEQLILNRLANTAIDIYTSMVVLSRATQSLNEDLPSAAYEKALVEAWVFEATNRAKLTLNMLETNQHLKNLENLATLGSSVLKNGTVVQTSPLKF